METTGAGIVEDDGIAIAGAGTSEDDGIKDVAVAAAVVVAHSFPLPFEIGSIEMVLLQTETRR